jgi:hypothetical protein
LPSSSWSSDDKMRPTRLGSPSTRSPVLDITAASGNYGNAWALSRGGAAARGGRALARWRSRWVARWVARLVGRTRRQRRVNDLHELAGGAGVLLHSAMERARLGLSLGTQLSHNGLTAPPPPPQPTHAPSCQSQLQPSLAATITSAWKRWHSVPNQQQLSPCSAPQPRCACCPPGPAPQVPQQLLDLLPPEAAPAQQSHA